jgi:hypothetical protein
MPQRERGMPSIVAGILLLAQAVAALAVVVSHPALVRSVVTTSAATSFEVTQVNVGAGVLVPPALGALALLGGLGRSRAATSRLLRWFEVSLSSSIILFLVALLNGIHELGALVAIYALSSSVALFGALHEERLERQNMRAAIFGAMIGIVPWGLVAWYEIVPALAVQAGPPSWVRVLTVAMLVLALARGANFWYSSLGTGRWSAPAFGARIGIVLRVLESSVLVWGVALAVVLGLASTLK